MSDLTLYFFQTGKPVIIVYTTLKTEYFFSFF